MNQRVLLPVCSALLLIPTLSVAARWNVYPDGSGDAATIQAAVDRSVSGDSVVLGPGVYRGPGNRNISFLGKALIVTSSAGMESTIIDCEGASGGFIFNSGEPQSALLQELTIINGSAIEGGGIRIENSIPTIRRCVVMFCSASRGGGIYCGGGSIGGPTIDYSLILWNSASYGGGFADVGGWARVRFNTIRGNTAAVMGGGICTDNDLGQTAFNGNTIERNSAASGGGVWAQGGGFELVGNRILNNSSATGAGVYLSGVVTTALNQNLIAYNQGAGVYVDGSVVIRNCTIVENGSHGVESHSSLRPLITNCIIAYNYGSVVCVGVDPHGFPRIDCCDMFGNTSDGPCAGSVSNLIMENPLFCTATGEQSYYLRADSPCAPVLSPCGTLIGAFPVLCDPLPPGPAVLTCPPDVTANLSPLATQVTIGQFSLTNNAAAPAAYNYRVTSSGPAILWDRGYPLALEGKTPTLLPGETYQPPQAGLVVAEGSTGSQRVQLHVYYGAGDNRCNTFITFAQPVPVAFGAFEAVLDGRSVHLTWSMSHDGEADVIDVSRKVIDADAPAATVIAHLRVDTSEFTDVTAEPGRVNEYQLVVMNDGEVVSLSYPIRVHVPALTLEFQSVWPNPFRASTRIAFDVPSQGHVTLEVFDVLGRRVRTLWNGSLPPGAHRVQWNGDAENAVSGVYFIRLSQGNASVTTKMILVR
jgi:hypothetical protein